MTGGPVRRGLDWSNLAAVSRWLVNLRVAIDDADSVVEDMLRPPRERELGPALHREQYAEAHQQIRGLLAFAEPPESERGDPAGSGGSPAH
jgi:hypothetical protein